jgi:hypothetical protein
MENVMKLMSNDTKHFFANDHCVCIIQYCS